MDCLFCSGCHIDVFDEIVLALLETGDFLSDTMLQPTFDRHPTQRCVFL